MNVFVSVVFKRFSKEKFLGSFVNWRALRFGALEITKEFGRLVK